jgi:hypothetical protein
MSTLEELPRRPHKDSIARGFGVLKEPVAGVQSLLIGIAESHRLRGLPRD